MYILIDVIYWLNCRTETNKVQIKNSQVKFANWRGVF